MTQWEYRVESIGSSFRSITDEDLESVMDEWGEDGWELVGIQPSSTTNKVRLVAKRPLEDISPRRRPIADWRSGLSRK